MKSSEMKVFRLQYNKKLAEEDDFFAKFGMLDDQAYSEGAIDKKHKELMGLAISLVTRFNECICYRRERIEAIKIGVIGGGIHHMPECSLCSENDK